MASKTPKAPAKGEPRRPPSRLRVIALGALLGAVWGAVMWGIFTLAGSDTDGRSLVYLMISMAKAWTSDASRRVVAHGQQIHGGIGFTKEYKIQLDFRRQKWMELMWGDADYHRELVAEKLEV